jgi:hypothetical protein
MLDMRSSEIHSVIDSLGKNGNYEGYHPTLRTAIWDYATGNWSRAMVSKNWRLYLGTATAMIEDLELFKQEAQYKPWSELSFHWDVNRIKNTCIFVGMFFGSFVDLPDRFVKTAVLLEMGKISIELEIFRNDKGAYPENLDDFRLRFTSSSLLDPMTGEPFKYKTTIAGGYVLSSVGLQGSEDYVGNKTRSTKGLTGNIHWIIDESNKDVSQFSVHAQD